MSLVSWLTVPALIFTLLYVVVQLVVWRWWHRGMSKVPLDNPDFHKPFVSVIIAARNEENHIQTCLASLSRQDISPDQFEVILVNDQSDDKTLENARAVTLPNLKIFTLPSDLQGKKDALRFGISKSKGSFLLFTDADCIVPISWVRSMRNYFVNGNLDAICAPISMKPEKVSLLSKFQQLDNIGMMAVSAAAIHGNYFSMANGANLGIKRSILSGNTVEWNDQLASGDDMALISHVQKENGRINFVQDREVVVITGTEPTWTDFFNQRLRWGTKNKSSRQPGLKIVVGIVFFTALSHVFALILFPIYVVGFLGNVTPWLWACLFLKPMLDTLVLSGLTSFFNVRIPVWRLFLYAFLHSFYIFIMGSLSLVLVEYPWKGRRLK